ncbi:hypothetical protein ACFQZ1_23175 [Bacillus sp. CGMCC 1.60114]|uniref:hypothetical protein n=1 Tax=unclassified Bacillus (in: firmicutes) TaxID=185979 RepID=UPI00362A6193
MEEKKQLEQMKKNILDLSIALIDAPFHGVSNEKRIAMEFAINKILENTGITIESLLKEQREMYMLAKEDRK